MKDFCGFVVISYLDKTYVTHCMIVFFICLSQIIVLILLYMDNLPNVVLYLASFDSCICNAMKCTLIHMYKCLLILTHLYSISLFLKCMYTYAHTHTHKCIQTQKYKVYLAPCRRCFFRIPFFTDHISQTTNWSSGNAWK